MTKLLTLELNPKLNQHFIRADLGACRRWQQLSPTDLWGKRALCRGVFPWRGLKSRRALRMSCFTRTLWQAARTLCQFHPRWNEGADSGGTDWNEWRDETGAMAYKGGGRGDGRDAGCGASDAHGGEEPADGSDCLSPVRPLLLDLSFWENKNRK